MKKSMPVEKLKASKKPIPVKIVSDGPSYPAEDKKWRAEDDIRTMQRAADIQKDKSRVKAMKEVAKEQMNQLKKICP